MQENDEAIKVSTRDAFTAALLRRAAKNLGVPNFHGGIQATERETANELERTRAEIRSREHVFGVEDCSLIPLFVKEGDLAPTREVALSCYQRAFDVLEANKNLKRDSMLMSDKMVSSYADLGSRFFRHGQYRMAEDVFAKAVSICREKTVLESTAISSLWGLHIDLENSHRLQGHLQDWKSGTETARNDISILLSNAAAKLEHRREVRDACT